MKVIRRFCSTHRIVLYIAFILTLTLVAQLFFPKGVHL